MTNSKIQKWFVSLLLILFLYSCDKGENISPPNPEPKPPIDPIVLSPLKDLVNADEFISDSIWKDSITHTVHVKVGPRLVLHPSLRKKIFPGAIINKNAFSFKVKEEFANTVETLPVTLNFSDNPAISFIPSYENFISEVNSYLSKNTKPFENASSDNGRPFSTYSDLILVNGYKNEPSINWLTINNKQSKLKKTGVVYSFKTIDLGVSINLPRAGELIDRNKYKSQIEADSLSYVNQINIGKRVVVTFMCDTTFEGARAVITKLKNNTLLSNEEEKILQGGEIGYFLQGYGNVTISSKNNAEIVKNIYSITRNTSTAGEPIEFFVRSIKDLAPYSTNIKLDIIRK